ncbi:MAG: nuclear transport factor 2 family protein [Firmicutes bacterium]|nr:nuclear transport factor 2 family protein [Bacillota bacterium]
MNKIERIKSFWQEMNLKHWENLYSYFHERAVIIWPNTNEIFDVLTYVEINEEYPGSWTIELNKIIESNQQVITVERIFSTEEKTSLHGTSFFTFEQDKIIALEEYFSEDGSPPIWRR